MKCNKYLKIQFGLHAYVHMCVCVTVCMCVISAVCRVAMYKASGETDDD